MQLTDLLQHIEVVKVVGNDHMVITGIQSDSRKVTQGNVFVAQAGTAVDGHTFIAQCVEKGASAIVLDNPNYMPATSEEVCYILVKSSDEALGKMAHYWYGEPTKHLQLVGVTGTNGKTTTATLLYKLFKSLGHKVGLLSTVVNYVDEEAIPATHTTPDALSLNALLAQMVNAGCQYAFMEVSSHAIAQQRIAGLEYAGALFTNLTRDHLDYHKTFDHYRDTKKQLFDQLPKTAFAITNNDDKNGRDCIISGYRIGYIASPPDIAAISIPTIAANEPKLALTEEPAVSGATTISDVYSLIVLKAIITPKTKNTTPTFNMNFHFDSSLATNCSKSVSFNNCFFSFCTSIILYLDYFTI